MNNDSKKQSSYPFQVSIGLITTAILLSFVDLTFLNDVIGKVLDVGPIESMLVAFSLGLVGIAIMAHQGIQNASGTTSTQERRIHFVIWSLLGIIIVAIRLFSARILELDAEELITIVGLQVRQVDLVFAPLMLVLYMATGLMVLDATKNLLLSPDFAKWQKYRKKSKADKIAEMEAAKAAAIQTKIDSEAEREKEREEEFNRTKAGIIAAQEAQDLANEKDQVQKERDAKLLLLNEALAAYKNKLDQIKGEYRTISSNLDEIEAMDKKELEFETKVKPRLINIVDESILSAQNSIALRIRKITNEEIVNLRHVIEVYNDNKISHK